MRRRAGTQIAPSTGYATRARRSSMRSVIDASRTAAIRAVHAENYIDCGSRKVRAQLVRQGQPMARCSGERLMRAARLRV